MIFIDARCVLYNLICERNNITREHINAFATHLKQNEHTAYIEIDDDSIYSAVESNPGVFEMRNDIICRGGNSWHIDRDFLDKTINREFSKGLRDKIHEASIFAGKIKGA